MDDGASSRQVLDHKNSVRCEAKNVRSGIVSERWVGAGLNQHFRAGNL